MVGTALEQRDVRCRSNWKNSAAPGSKKSCRSCAPNVGRCFRRRGPTLLGAFLLIHDDTEARQREQELLIKATMIKELHHRVKNDLQTVASLLRMQARRLQTTEAKGALAEAVNRILSIAVIHEFLSEQDTRVDQYPRSRAADHPANATGRSRSGRAHLA